MKVQNMIMPNSYVNNCSANTKWMKSRVRQTGAFSMALYNQGELSKGNKQKWTVRNHVGGETSICQVKMPEKSCWGF